MTDSQISRLYQLLTIRSLLETMENAAYARVDAFDREPTHSGYAWQERERDQRNAWNLHLLRARMSVKIEEEVKNV